MKETRKSRGEIYLDFLADFMNAKIVDENGVCPDDVDRMVAAGIVLAFGEAKEQTGIINEELLCKTCERFFGEHWLAVITRKHDHRIFS